MRCLPHTAEAIDSWRAFCFDQILEYMEQKMIRISGFEPNQTEAQLWTYNYTI